MALKHGYTIPTNSVPTPSDTPFETPGLGTSSQSSRHGSTSSFATPLAYPPDNDSYFPRSQADKDAAYVEKRSSRRFTSDLDNSLIQQIHSLRLDRDEKNTAVERLEETLHECKIDNEKISAELATQTAETRSVKKQMQLLESGTLAALGDLAKERDDAMGIVNDTRKRLEVSNRMLRSQEEDAEREQEMKGKERESWFDEKRTLERKVHVLESRLKTMVAEMVAAESSWTDHPDGKRQSTESTRGEKAEGDTFSIRSNSRADSRMSVRSNDPGRAPSRLSVLHELGESASSLSLADELGDNDSEQEQEDDHIASQPGSPEALPEEVVHQPARIFEDHKARKMMGLPFDYSRVADECETSNQFHAGPLIERMQGPARSDKIVYSDNATQCSPPPSPKHSKQGSSDNPPHATSSGHVTEKPKRVSIPSVFLGQMQAPTPAAPKPAATVSTSSQTDDLDERFADTSHAVPPATWMTDNATQTAEEAEILKPDAATRLDIPSMDIPFISIQPPASRPSSSHASVMLPPRTKNASCQADVDLPRSVRSMSMQTEEIKVGNRPARLPPPRLASVHALAQPTPWRSDRRQHASGSKYTKVPKRNLKSPPPMLQHEPPPESPPISSIKDVYPGKNDDGPLNDKNQSGPRRPIRSDSIFAGFSDDNDEVLDTIGDDLSDEDFGTAAPMRKTLSKVKDSWKLVPHAQDSALNRLQSASDSELQAKAGSSEPIKDADDPVATTSKTFQAKAPPPPLRFGTTKQQDVRKVVPVTSDQTDYGHRRRSPSAPSVPSQIPTVEAPPFPVPTRSSSRKIPISASEGAGSPTPYSTSFFTTGRKNPKRRPPIKPKMLRKTQSAAAVTKSALPAPPTEAPPPPPLPASTVSTISNPPSTPPRRPRNQFILPYPSEAEEKKHSIDPEPAKSADGDTLNEASSQHTSVVDAIAQTMVGEWMWKYVRKRSSFGITENSQTEFQSGKVGETGAIGGVRHKRWVWLAPYERAVIWSGKQPTSGPALLGKGGRKLAIQSVLDVKDDTPLPKGSTHEQIFNRSILILTPDRALKITAVSKERHYIWLTALSFLSASSQGMTDPETPSPEQHPQLPRPPSQEPVVSLRRAPIRDSIRVSKAKSRPSIGQHSFTSPPSEISFSNLPPLSFDSIDRPSEDAAEPPQIPRTAIHTRKRSSTGPRAIPLSSFSNYPNNAAATKSSIDFHIPTAREKFEKGRPFSRGVSNPVTTHTTMTRSTADSHIVPNDFFDAVGTVRMEAFVQDKENHPEEKKKKAKESRGFRHRQERKKDMSYWGVTEGSMGSEGRRSEDPFRGF